MKQLIRTMTLLIFCAALLATAGCRPDALLQLNGSTVMSTSDPPPPPPPPPPKKGKIISPSFGMLKVLYSSGKRDG